LPILFSHRLEELFLHVSNKGADAGEGLGLGIRDLEKWK
jgi:hypothetical protein